MTHTSQAMSWHRATFRSLDDFSVRLSAAEREELASAVKSLDARVRDIAALRRSDFPLSAPLEAKLAAIYAEVRAGRGFVLLRGLPVEGQSIEQFSAVNWLVGTRLGFALSQNAKGELIGHVVDATQEESTPRYFRTALEARMHNDITAMITLSCWRPAQSGGASLVASAVRVHDVIAEKWPHLLEPLYRGFHHHRLGEEAPGEAAVTPYRMPVFSIRSGQVSCRYQRSAIAGGHKALGIPLTPLEIEALDAFDRTAQAKENRVAFYMQPGDMQILNNYSAMHARTAFKDFKEPEKRRHLVRLWLDAPNFRDVPPEMNLHLSNGVPAQPGKDCTFDFAKLFAGEKSAGGMPNLELDEAEIL